GFEVGFTKDGNLIGKSIKKKKLLNTESQTSKCQIYPKLFGDDKAKNLKPNFVFGLGRVWS
ncbi:MAG: hypothetical protein MR902_07670, partial [Campylobacter sp.]|nr:hypothetical protein [Campylobacter sp.]